MNITLICTGHVEYGNCNSMELHKIIEEINPEIIFEELSYSHFDESYKEKKLITLETNAIKDYLQNHNIEHIPVDTYKLPNSYQKELEYMLDRVIKHNKIESYHLRNLLDNQSLLIGQNGFDYLNSNQNDKIFEEIAILRGKILDTLSDANLFRIDSLEKEVVEKREYEIINNIYKYTKGHPYNQAILFIGSGHRQSIIKKIEKYEMQEKIKLNWILYND
jgi:hypothetical protein